MKGVRYDFLGSSSRGGAHNLPLAAMTIATADVGDVAGLLHKIAAQLVKASGMSVSVVRRGPSENPREDHRTLVHAGYAQAAQFHVLSHRGAPLADLYVGKRWAIEIAHLLADKYGEPVKLVTHQAWQDTLNQESSFPVKPTAARKANPKRRKARKRNPGSGLVVGQRRTVFLTGQTVTVKALQGSRAQVRDSDTGNTEWVHAGELTATSRLLPARRTNPARTAPRFRAHGSRPGLSHGGPGLGRGQAPGTATAIAYGRTTATATATASPTVHSPTSTSTSTEAQTSTDTDTSTSTETRSPSSTRTSTNPRRRNARSAGTPFARLEAAHRATIAEYDRATGARKATLRRRLVRFGEMIAKRYRGALLPKANPPRRCKANPRRRNPAGGDELGRAVDAFRMWHEFEPEKLTPVEVHSRKVPRYLVTLGKVRRIDYDSSKWEGRLVTYTHKTKRPYPTLATDPDARALYLVGGKMKPTADGLVN